MKNLKNIFQIIITPWRYTHGYYASKWMQVYDLIQNIVLFFRNYYNIIHDEFG